MSLVRAMKTIVFLLVFPALMLAHAVAIAQQPSALALEKSGSVVPDIKPYSEVSVGTKISLKGAAKLVFLHYYTCQTVSVIGGTIEFGAETYSITGGKRESEKRTPCPRVVTLNAGAEAAGVLFRSGISSVMLKFTPQPTFVLAGKRADTFGSVRVIKDRKVLTEARLEDRIFHWPRNATPLPVETNYELELVPVVSGATPVKMSFSVSEAAEAPGTQEMLLIRVD